MSSARSSVNTRVLLGGTTEPCDVGSGLGDRDSVAELFPVLEPRQVASNGTASRGPVAAYLGRLASMLDRYDEAAVSTPLRDGHVD